MFADLWKLANKLAAEEYAGFTLESVRGIGCEELMSSITDASKINSTIQFLRYIVKLDPINPGAENVQGNKISPVVFLFAYPAVLFPEKTIWGDLDLPIAPELIAATHQLETASKVTGSVNSGCFAFLTVVGQDLVEKFEKALDDCKMERRLDAHGVRVALVRYSKAFVKWGPVHKIGVTRRIRRLLWDLHKIGISDTSNEAQMTRRWMVVIAGQAALDEFDAARMASNLDALVPSEGPL